MRPPSGPRLKATWLILIGLGVFGGCGFPRMLPNMQPLAKETRTVIVDHVSESPVEVQTANGSVSVEKSDLDDVEIVAQLKATSADRLAATKIVAQRSEDDALDVHVDWAGGGDFLAIQEGINAAGTGDTVLVAEGDYDDQSILRLPL